MRFYGQGPRYAFHFTRDAVMLSFMEDTAASRGVVLGLRFIGANPRVMVHGEDRAPGEVNYLHGNEPARWQTAVPRYARVAYRGLWPGVDLLLRADGATLQYEFHVRRGARISDIRLAYDGANRLTLDEDGSLSMETALGVMRDSRPVSYQTIAGERVPVDSRYLLNGNQFGFALGANV